MTKMSNVRLCGATAAVLAAALLAGCGGGGGGGDAGSGSVQAPPAPPATPAAPRYAVGGTVSGLAQGTSVTLSNGADSVTAAANGSFSFPAKLLAGAAYNVTAANPAGHACVLKDGAGTVAGADVTTVSLKCTSAVLAGLESVVMAPAGVAIDAGENTFVLDAHNQVIVKVTKAGVATTLAGTRGLSGNQDGTGDRASFFFTSASRGAIDAQGNLIVTDTCNQLLRKITPAGVVVTIAGARGHSCSNYYNLYSEGTPSSADGIATTAVFAHPRDIAIGKNGDMLVTEAGSRSIRRVTPVGVVTTEKYFTTAEVSSVAATAFDRNGALYVATAGSAQKIWTIQDGKAVFVAGGPAWKGAPALPPDGNGSGASFVSIAGMAVDNSGNMYVADLSMMRKLTPAGAVTTLAGGIDRGGINGVGSAARLGQFGGMAVDANGNAVVGQYDRADLRVITPGGAVSNLAGTPPARDYVDGQGAGARFNQVQSIAAGPDGSLYTADATRHVVRKVSASGAVTLFAGVVDNRGALNGAVGVATFNSPRAIAVDKNGAVYVADALGIRKIAAGQVTLLTAPLQSGTVYSLAVDGVGNLAASVGQTVYQVSPAGVVTTLVDQPKAQAALRLGSRFYEFDPVGLVYDAAGNLYISDMGHVVVYKYTKSGVLSVFAGTPTVEGDTDGPVGTATLGFYTIDSLAIDDAGNLYLSGQGRMRKISPAGVVSTPALAWGVPNLTALAYYKGMLYGATRYAIVQAAVN